MEIIENHNTLTATYDPVEWDVLCPEVLNLRAATHLIGDRDSLKGQFMHTLLNHCPGFAVDEHNVHTLTILYQWAIGDSEGALNPLKGIWLYGSEGCGKSTIALALSSFIKTVRADNRHHPDGRIECAPYNDSRLATLSAWDVIDALHTKGDARYELPRVNVLTLDDLTEESMSVNFGEMNVRILPWLLSKRCGILRRDGFVRPTIVTCNFEPERLAALTPDLIGKLCCSFNFVLLKGLMRGNYDSIYYNLR